MGNFHVSEICLAGVRGKNKGEKRIWEWKSERKKKGSMGGVFGFFFLRLLLGLEKIEYFQLWKWGTGKVYSCLQNNHVCICSALHILCLTFR